MIYNKNIKNSENLGNYYISFDNEYYNIIISLYRSEILQYIYLSNRKDRTVISSLDQKPGCFRIFFDLWYEMMLILNN